MMQAINVNTTRIECVSEVMNKVDGYSIITIIALSILTNIIGVTCNSNLNLSKESCSYTVSVGTSILLAMIGIVIFKIFRHCKFKKESHNNLRYEAINLPENQYKVKLFDEFQGCILTKEVVYVFKDFERLTTKVIELETIGKIDSADSHDADYTPIPPSNELLKGEISSFLPTLTITVLSLPSFIVPYFHPFPYFWSIQTLALGILGATTYGMATNQLSIRQSKNYFILGHNSGHTRLLTSENLTANALAYGINYSCYQGLLSGILLSLTSTIPDSKAINPNYHLPFIFSGLTFVFVYAHIKSKKREELLRQPCFIEQLNKYFNNWWLIPLKNIPTAERPAYLSLYFKGSMNYGLTALLGASLIIASIATRIFLST